jgi:hypothetical protein
MSYLSANSYKGNDATAPRAWVSLLGVFLSAVIMVVAAKIALNLYPKRSDFLASEKVAAETYNQYLITVSTSLTQKCQDIADLNVHLCQHIADPVFEFNDLITFLDSILKEGIRWNKIFEKQQLSAT